MELMTYLEFTINFFIIFAIFINILLLIAAVFKTKNYSMEVLLLGMISFCIFMAVHEFLNLTAISYRVTGSTYQPEDSLISEMFALMASMLIFGVGVTKNRLEKFKLGSKK